MMGGLWVPLEVTLLRPIKTPASLRLRHYPIAQDSIMTREPPDRFLRLNAVLDRTGLSRATLYRKLQQGTFPRQVKLAERCVGWRESAITDWQRNPFFYTVGSE